MELVDERGAINDPFRNFIAVSRYARWVEDENRRETWSETVDRYTDFMADHMAKNYKYKMDKKEIRKAILNHEVMPSMRALMTAGPAAERDNMSLYNCSFIAVDSPRSFDEALYVLMNGTGVGFSVESEHVSKLPMVNEHFEDSETVIVVGDSKGGWARGLRELIAMLYVGQVPSWDTSGVRTAGARLKTFGGRASGPEPLEDLFRFVTDVFRGAAGRKLLPIEAHDIMCKIGECVVVGGVRRCFGDNAEIHTDRGVVLGKDISIDDMIISGGRKARVTAKIDSGRQLTVIVKHQYGQSEMTPNHRIAVFDGVDSYTFKEAGSLEPGDRLVWDLAGYDGEIQSLPKPSYLGHFNAKSFKIPDMLDTDVAWLIGLVHGDGHIHAKGIEISSNDGEWDTLERANIIFTKSFGVSGKVSRDSHDGHGIRLRINSTGLAMWFAENIKTPNVSIRIPEFIKFAQRDVRAAYLAGVLDSDGRIRPDGVIDQATTIYIDFSRDLSEILRSLGIPSKIKKSSAQRRRDNGVNAKDFWTTSVSTKTGHGLYFESAGKYSQKNILARVGNTGDFTYPAEFGLSYRARNTTRSWAIEKGLLDKDFPFAPVRVESVEIGTVQQTWDIEVEDIHEFTADGLVTHNSALISLSDSGDFDMAKAKSGKWWESQPHRRLSNNSAVYTSKPSVGKFLTEWSHLWESQSGERGIFNKEGNQHHASSNGRRDGSKISGTNPCAEIILRSYQTCNLTEVVVRPDDTFATLTEKVRIAATMGTIQSSLVNFKYLRKIWKDNCEEERLLGVSLTGQMGHPVLNGSNGLDKTAKWLDKLREVAIDTNAEVADKMGINHSTAITTVKPSGTVSQLTQVSSGMHYWHSEYYIRTVRADNKDPLTAFLQDIGIPSEPDTMAPNTSTVFSFPIAAPANARSGRSVSAIEHLNIWKIYKKHWTEHNPSITVSVKDDEWVEVAAWVYDNWEDVGGLSFLPFSDHIYEQAPYQEITAEEYQELKSKMPVTIPWENLSLYELIDGTTGSQELACVANSCETVDITPVAF